MVVLRSRIFLRKVPEENLNEEVTLWRRADRRVGNAQVHDSILRQGEDGVAVSEFCRKHGMSSASFYKWCAKYGGMDASMIAQMKDLAKENRRLKKMYAEKCMQNELLKEALGKKH